MPRGQKSPTRRRSSRSRLNPRATAWSQNNANINSYLKEINEVRMSSANKNKRNMNKYLKEINVERSRGGSRRTRKRKNC